MYRKILQYILTSLLVLLGWGNIYAQTQPNVLIIVTDDQGYADMSIFPTSAPDINTPHMDNLANDGVLFRRTYVTAPVCSPSRSGLFTGRYQQRWGGWSWKVGLPESEKTLAEYFKEAGYHTAMVGKNDWGNHYHREDVREYPLNHGYDQFLGFSSHAHDYFLMSREIEQKTPDPHGSSASLGPLQYNHGHKSIENGYTTEIFADQAIQFINNEQNSDSPFLLTVTFNAVHHMIHEVPERYLKKFGVDPIPKYDPSMGKYSKYYQKYTNYGAIPPDQMRKYYLASLACLDDNIGRVLDALHKTNEAENTLIVYISDNGGSPLTGANNYPLRGSKYLTYEGGVRVPMIISWPGIYQKGKMVDEAVSSLDVVPTLLDATGISKPSRLDGISLDFWLKGEDKTLKRQEPVYSIFGDQAAIIDGDWKLVKSKEMIWFYGGRKRVWPASGDDFRLFHLKDDINEKMDLSNKYPDKKYEILLKYEEWSKNMHKQNNKYDIK